jgi:hypothetical protein
MWIKAEDGNAYNTDFWEEVEILPEGDEYVVTAVRSANSRKQNSLLPLVHVKTRDEAQIVLERLIVQTKGLLSLYTPKTEPL